MRIFLHTIATLILKMNVVKNYKGKEIDGELCPFLVDSLSAVVVMKLFKLAVYSRENGKASWRRVINFTLSEHGLGNPANLKF